MGMSKKMDEVSALWSFPWAGTIQDMPPTEGDLVLKLLKGKAAALRSTQSREGTVSASAPRRRGFSQHLDVLR